MNLQKYKRIGLGCLTYVPGLHALLHRGTGGTNSARYCYSVWLRHLVHNAKFGFTPVGKSIAELGPGDSLGIGLSALLCGADYYLALDAVSDARTETNLVVFEDLVDLFRKRTPIPDDSEFPNVHPRLTDYSFPEDLLPNALLEDALSTRRLDELRQDLRRFERRVRYVPGWASHGVAQQQSVDLIISQAVLEHVDDIRATYEAMHYWLKAGGVMSHQVDFKCHETSNVWNGHLQYSQTVWTVMRGRLPYLLNRGVYSDHLRALESTGFRFLAADCVRRHDGLARNQLARQFQRISDDDLTVSGAFLQASKPMTIAGVRSA
jgi:hypothetical protein